MRWKTDEAGSYQVALPGEFGPTFLATFADLGVGRTATTSVFLLSVPEHLGIHDVTAMLQARGLEILDIRRVAGSPPRDEAPPTSMSEPRP
jgi:hypothetical protein